MIGNFYCEGQHGVEVASSAARSNPLSPMVFPQKRIDFLLDDLSANYSLCLFALMCSFILFLPALLVEKTLLHNAHLTLFTSVSSLIRNGYLRLRTFENGRLLLRRAINLNFKPLLVMHTT
jgi:hypothetical protein